MFTPPSVDLVSLQALPELLLDRLDHSVLPSSLQVSRLDSNVDPLPFAADLLQEVAEHTRFSQSPRGRTDGAHR